MIPEAVAAETFRLFNAIPHARIDGDLDDTPDNYNALGELIQAYYKLGEAERTPEVCADYLHNQLIQACAGLKHPSVDDRVAFHLVGVGSRSAAQVAVQSALARGELGKLNEAMDKIRDASDDQDFDESDPDDQPREYVELAEKAGDWLAKIERMLMVDILRKYRLYDAAALFEADEEAFDARVTEGYYVLFPEKRRR